MILFGISLFIYPTVASWLIEKETASYVEVFNRDYMPAKTEEESIVKKKTTRCMKNQLLTMKRYLLKGRWIFRIPGAVSSFP